MSTLRICILVILSICIITFLPAQSITNTLGGNTDVEVFDVEDSDNNTLLRIQGDGKVGIGKTDPDSLLDVAGTTKTEGLMLPTGASDGNVLTSDGSGNATWQAPVADGDWTPSGNNIYNSNSGNVGLGTSSPDSLLDVVGTIKTQGFMMPTGAEDGAKLTSDADGNASWVQTIIIEKIELQLWDSTGNDIYNKNTDFVGIGTETPATKLDVDGVITATGGNSTNWNTAYGWGDHPSGLGTYTEKLYDWTYTASTDGQVVASALKDTLATVGSIYGKISGSIRLRDSSTGGWASITFPVRKGQSWSVEVGGMFLEHILVYWIPLGN
ncbi:hypothetical protein ACFL46_02695 [Candidatus Neomarinimicrobiota bacterium]